MPTEVSISALSRDRTIDALEAAEFDCLVIGGGITGAGIAREASLRGFSVALLEADDFASGTSSRSSKLIHGGLRYLAMGDVALVRETALERRQILRLAPHLVQPIRVVLPVRSRASLLKLRVGISAYEKLGAVDEGDIHSNWSEVELEGQEPLLNHARFPHACAYSEYLTDDARLVLANLRGAVADAALVLNHARVEVIRREQNRATGVEAVCALSGRRFHVRAGAVVNAAGPWVEAVQRLEDAQARPMLVLSKGIHIVLPYERIPVRNMFVLTARDSRSIFIIPRGPIVFIGTTDTLYPDGARYWPEITMQDVAYLLEPLPEYFAIEPVRVEEILAAWAGLRPLVAREGKKTTEISRRDEILCGPSNVVSIAGGKLTGYRQMARRAMEQVAERLGRRLAPRPQEAPLPGGDSNGRSESLVASLGRQYGVSEQVASRLVRLYGTESGAVAARGSDPLTPGSSVLTGEVDWAVQEEGAARLEDWLYRRSRVALYEPAERDAAVAPGGERMAHLLGWSPERTQEEVAQVRALFDSELAFARDMT